MSSFEIEVTKPDHFPITLRYHYGELTQVDGTGVYCWQIPFNEAFRRVAEWIATLHENGWDT